MNPAHFIMAALLTTVPALSAAAQEAHNHQETTEATIELPAICRTGTAASGHAADHGTPQPPEPENMDSAHRALLDSMSEMHETMGAAMMASDIDVAFVCGMIPHHQGAIAMAEAELEHGDDEWAKTLARQIIAAQEQEIADMLEWLNRQESAQ